jgi:hypothetical protein
LVPEPVVYLPLECVNPGDQGPQTPLVDFPLEPRDLITQVAQVVAELSRARM